MARTDPLKDIKKKQIQLYGTKKKTSAEKVLEDLRDANIPAILIKLPNDQVGVFNLKTNKYEYKGDISAESKTIQSNVQDLNNFSFARNVGTAETPVVQQEVSGDDVDVITSEDIYGKGTRYEAEEILDPAFGGGLFIAPELGVDPLLASANVANVYDDRIMRLARQNQTPIETTELAFMEDTEGDRSVAPFVEQTFPRRLTEIELNPQLKGPSPDDSFLVRTGDYLQKAFSLKTIVGQSPVSGSTVAIQQPFLSGLTANTLGLPVAYAAQGIGAKFQQKQITEATRAAEGVPGYSAFTAIDLATARPVDITSFRGKVTHQDIQGPIALDGKVFQTPLEAAIYAEENGLVTQYAMRMYGDIENLAEEKLKKDVANQRVQVDPTIGMGDYNSEDGTVNLGGGRAGEVTGIALGADGTLAFKTGQGGFVMGMGEMVGTSRGIATTGLRGDVGTKNINDLSLEEVQGLLNKVSTGEYTSTDKTTATLETIVDNFIDPTDQFVFDYTYGDYTTPNVPDMIPSLEIGVEREERLEGGMDFQSGSVNVGPFGISLFSETPTTDVYSEGFTGEVSFDPPAPQAPDPFFDQSDDGGDSFGGADTSSMGDTGFGGGGGFATAEGGRIGKQEGGTTVKPVSQIVQGAGFIAPQQNATDQQTIADDIPMEAEEGDFIINAPAAEFAGRQDVVDMILKAINSLKEKGVDIQYGNPKIPIKSRVQLAVSRNEVYIPKIIAEEIGYDKLEKINNRGKREVERRQQESQKQANRGGFIKKADGDVVNKESEEDTATQIAGLREIIQDLKRGFIEKFGTSPTSDKKSSEEELDKSKYGVERDKVKIDFRKFIRDRLQELKLKDQKQKETYDLLTDVEIDPKVDPRRGNVPLTQRDRSGLTLGLGFDLGRQGLKELQNYGFSKNLIEKLTPYLGLRGQIARKKHNQDMAFALTDEELDEVNRQVITYGMKEFDRDHPEYQATNPMDYAVLYSAYHVGGLRPDGTRDGKRIKRTPENPKAVRYITFKNVYDKTNDINQALEKGLINKISKGNEERNRAISAKNWFKTRPILSEKVAPIPKPKKPRVRSRGMITPKSRPQEMIMPIPRPERIQDNPDQESFLSAPVRV